MTLGCLSKQDIIPCKICGLLIPKGNVTEPIELCKQHRMEARLRLLREVTKIKRESEKNIR